MKRENNIILVSNPTRNSVLENYLSNHLKSHSAEDHKQMKSSNQPDTLHTKHISLNGSIPRTDMDTDLNLEATPNTQFSVDEKNRDVDIRDFQQSTIHKRILDMNKEKNSVVKVRVFLEFLYFINVLLIYIYIYIYI